MHKVITGFRQLMPKLVILIIIFILFSCSNDDIDVSQVSEESGDLKIYTPTPTPCAPYGADAVASDPALGYSTPTSRECPVTCLRDDADVPGAARARPLRRREGRPIGGVDSPQMHRARWTGPVPVRAVSPRPSTGLHRGHPRAVHLPPINPAEWRSWF